MLVTASGNVKGEPLSRSVQLLFAAKVFKVGTAIRLRLYERFDSSCTHTHMESICYWPRGDSNIIIIIIITIKSKGKGHPRTGHEGTEGE